nr:hypothetical protein [uncultured Rhodopila sp.]
MPHSILLLPFVAAFVVFVLRFYFREGASSLAKPSFLMAVGTSLTAVVFIVLNILSILPPYGALGFALIGLLLLGVSITRMFMI